MKTSLIIFSILASTAFSAAAQTGAETGTKRGEEVMAVLAKWADAVRDRDAKILSQIFDDDVLITTFDGKTRSKAEELAIFRPDPAIRNASVANEDVAIKLFGDVAVVTALTKMRMSASGRDTSVAFRFTAVFVKKEGPWRIVALQTTRVPQAAGGSGY